MDQLSELRAAVQSDFSVGEESGLFTPSTIDLAINRSYRKIGAMFKWEETRDSQKLSSLANHEYYAYPLNWRPNSIWKLTIDDLDQEDPLTFKDYMFEKENNLPSGMTSIWSNYGKKLFRYPVPTVDADKNMKIWGYKFVDKLTLDGDITIFSYSMPEINEAIVLEAGAILKNKGEIQQAQKAGVVVGGGLLSQEARSIVVTTWTKISQEQSKLVRTTPMFSTPDFFKSNMNARDLVKNKIGNF